jgi:hypothetical protein
MHRLNFVGIYNSANHFFEKNESGRGCGAEPGWPSPVACPDLTLPKRYTAVRFRSDGARPFFLARRHMQARATQPARVSARLHLPRGGWWSATVRSAAERFRRWCVFSGWACRGDGVHGGVDVVAMSFSRGSRRRRRLRQAWITQGKRWDLAFKEESPSQREGAWEQRGW